MHVTYTKFNVQIQIQMMWYLSNSVGVYTNSVKKINPINFLTLLDQNFVLLKAIKSEEMI